MGGIFQTLPDYNVLVCRVVLKTKSSTLERPVKNQHQIHNTGLQAVYHVELIDIWLLDWQKPSKLL